MNISSEVALSNRMWRHSQPTPHILLVQPLPLSRDRELPTLCLGPSVIIWVLLISLCRLSVPRCLQQTGSLCFFHTVIPSSGTYSSSFISIIALNCLADPHLMVNVFVLTHTSKRFKNSQLLFYVCSCLCTTFHHWSVTSIPCTFIYVPLNIILSKCLFHFANILLCVLSEVSKKTHWSLDAYFIGLFSSALTVLKCNCL